MPRANTVWCTHKQRHCNSALLGSAHNACIVVECVNEVESDLDKEQTRHASNLHWCKQKVHCHIQIVCQRIHVLKMPQSTPCPVLLVGLGTSWPALNTQRAAQPPQHNSDIGQQLMENILYTIQHLLDRHERTISQQDYHPRCLKHLLMHRS